MPNDPIMLEVTPPRQISLKIVQQGANVKLGVSLPQRVSLKIIRSGANIKLGITPPQIVQLKISSAGSQGIPGPITIPVIGEILTGTINGSNATFTTTFEFVPGTLQLYVNGVRQNQPDDFNTSGMQTVILAQSPTIGERLQVDYIKN